MLELWNLADTASTILEESETQFTSDTQLLSELGERLISNHLIALGELIKNSYDADATQVNVWLSRDGDKDFLILKDNGNGMRKDQFLVDWMRVGTRSKLDEQVSKKFHRPLTGSKGIGRFAVRFLGETLKLETVAQDRESKEYRRIIAYFPWSDFKEGELSKFNIHYQILGGASENDMGTTLTIGDLRFKWSKQELLDVTQEVLGIVDPPLPLSVRKRVEGVNDLGFKIMFGPVADGVNVKQAADELLDRWQAKMDIQVSGDMVSYTCSYKGTDVALRKIRQLREGNMIGDAFAQIRYYPMRKDLFKSMDSVKAKGARRLLRDKGGVRVFDRGFRMLPYGEPDDDWLKLARDKARNARDWGSKITQELYPRETLPRIESLDPTLSVPANHQLLGVVVVNSYHALDSNQKPVRSNDRLISAMDREGFLDNDAFRQLFDVVRGGVELIGIVDREESLKAKKEQEKQAMSEVNQKIDRAIELVETRSDIPINTRKDIINTYHSIRKAVTDTTEAHKETIRSVESMSLLGILAGFMTHETTLMEKNTKEMIEFMKKIPANEVTDDIKKALAAVEKAYGEINKQMNYTSLFVSRLKDKNVDPFLVKPQIEMIINILSSYINERHIGVRVDAKSNLRSPMVSAGIYTGILMNLLTNSIKAIVSPLNTKNGRHIVIKAFDSNKSHIVQVHDDGSGIPPAIQEFIFEPFVTTTSDIEGPFGPGMGLGLYICKRVIESIGGKIRVVKPLQGFSTCFEVSYGKSQ